MRCQDKRPSQLAIDMQTGQSLQAVQYKCRHTYREASCGRAASARSGFIGSVDVPSGLRSSAVDTPDPEPIFHRDSTHLQLIGKRESARTCLRQELLSVPSPCCCRHLVGCDPKARSALRS